MLGNQYLKLYQYIKCNIISTLELLNSNDALYNYRKKNACAMRVLCVFGFVGMLEYVRNAIFAYF